MTISGDDIKALRQDLHQIAELSGQEFLTRKRILRFLEPYNPQQVQSLAQSKGLLITFDSGQEGRRILFRADLDALPIQETQERTSQSRHPGISHQCGHDGHMALVASLAAAWKALKPKQGCLGLLFQHAEETGAGAMELLEDTQLQTWKPDVILGFHNIPGVATGTVITGEDPCFALASCGLKISLKGRSCHAAEPSKGLSPLASMLSLEAYSRSLCTAEAGLLLTLVGFHLGQDQYGVCPGEGYLCFTVRSKSDQQLSKALKAMEQAAQREAQQRGLGLSTERLEAFPATMNDEKLSKFIRDRAVASGLVATLAPPFPWSEDFGHYRKLAPSCYFGLGMGEQVPPLHDPAYYFDDDVLDLYHRFLSDVLAKLL